MKIVNCKLEILAVAVFLLFQSQTGIVSAQEPAISPIPKPVEYELPHPGLLPHHPLYFLRAMRDAMQTLLVSSPSKKAEFYLLQADKSLSASIMLADQKETVQLGGATAFESQEYFEKALEEVGHSKRQGVDIQEIVKKLALANEKHQEVLTSLAAGVPEERKETFIQAREKAKNAEKKVKAFLPFK